MSQEKITNAALSDAKVLKLRQLGLETKGLTEAQKAQVALLDDDECAVLASIKGRLNEGLTEQDPEDSAQTSGAFVW